MNGTKRCSMLPKQYAPMSLVQRNIISPSGSAGMYASPDMPSTPLCIRNASTFISANGRAMYNCEAKAKTQFSSERGERM